MAPDSWNVRMHKAKHYKLWKPQQKIIILICQLVDITWGVLSNQKVAGSWENAAAHSLSQQDLTATDHHRWCVAAGVDSKTTNVQGVGSIYQDSGTWHNKQHEMTICWTKAVK
jgi:Flp pilus assembly protein TadG